MSSFKVQNVTIQQSVVKSGIVNDNPFANISFCNATISSLPVYCSLHNDSGGNVPGGAHHVNSSNGYLNLPFDTYLGARKHIYFDGSGIHMTLKKLIFFGFFLISFNSCLKMSSTTATAAAPTPAVILEHDQYSVDIFNVMMSIENKSKVDPEYMSRRTSINSKMRAILIDWIVEVHAHYKFELETLFLTVNIIDRYLAIEDVHRKNLQLVGITALFMACKYEEVSFLETEEYANVTDNAYTVKEILDMEADIFKKLGYCISVPSSNKFLGFFTSVIEVDIGFCTYFIERILQEYSMIKFLPSILASSAIYIMREDSKEDVELWPSELEKLTGYKEEDLEECVDMMKEICGKISRPSTTALRAVDKKYGF
jgi:G2/mitotic-specific cyclin-B, other